MIQADKPSILAVDLSISQSGRRISIFTEAGTLVRATLMSKGSPTLWGASSLKVTLLMILDVPVGGAASSTVTLHSSDISVPGILKLTVTGTPEVTASPSIVAVRMIPV